MQYRAPILVLIALAFAVALGVPAFQTARESRPRRSDARETISFAGPTMGTRYSVKLAIPDAAERLEELQHAVDARLAEINRRMSTYDPGSELSRFNQSDSTDWLDLSDETVKVVAYALQIARATDGRFDPTVGPVVNLWGFGPDGRRKAPPNDDEVRAALARVGYQAVEVRENPPALRKSNPTIYVDLSAIAKGYAVDAVSDLLAEHGATASMVEIGGEVVCRGKKPDGSTWKIGVEKPDETGRALQAVIELEDRAIATSGDYRNFFEQDGQRFSHTINPRTGRPVQHTLATVSVQASTCMRADALATALLVMGPDEGYNWAKEHNVAALLIERNTDGFHERRTPAWELPTEDGK